MINSRQEESTPVPCHVSVDNSNGSDSTTTLSPVTLDSSPTAKKHLFREEARIMGSTIFHPRKLPEKSISVEASDNFHAKKADDILSCLGGVQATAVTRKSRQDISSKEEQERVVDLWCLRQQALTRGGLLNASIRKQAWLKLVDANEDVLMSPSTQEVIQIERKPNGNAINFAKLSDEEIKMIKLDIKKCIWDIKAEMKRSRHSKNYTNPSTVSGSVSKDENASLASLESVSGQIDAEDQHSLAPETVATFTSCDESFNSNTIEKPHLILSPKAGIVSQSFARHRKEQQLLLLNIITSVLRTSEEELRELGMERIFYFPGMHNVAAPILITLQSPSLTSLVLKRLAQYHLKDSMVSTFVDIQATIRAMFMPLLQHVDEPLHDLLIKSGATDPCMFSLRWILCWFANDVPDYDIVARLFDAFLVSHYSFPIYVAVAMLTNATNRKLIERSAHDSDKTLIDAITDLPSRMVTCQSQKEAMNSFENVLETSLFYMYVNIDSIMLIIFLSSFFLTSTNIRQETSPAQLVDLADRSSNKLVISSVLILKKASKHRFRPLWTYNATASTDWDIIQEAKKMRGLSPNSRVARHFGRQEKLNELDREYLMASTYDLALDASDAEDFLGDMVREGRKKDLGESKRRFLQFLCFVAVGICSSSLLHISRTDNHASGNHTSVLTVEKEQEQITMLSPKILEVSTRMGVLNAVEDELLESETVPLDNVTLQDFSGMSMVIKEERNIMHMLAKLKDGKEEKGVSVTKVAFAAGKTVLKKILGLLVAAKAFVESDPDLFFLLE